MCGLMVGWKIITSFKHLNIMQIVIFPLSFFVHGFTLEVLPFLCYNISWMVAIRTSRKDLKNQIAWQVLNLYTMD
jgi:hypothetical protein